TPSRRDAPEPLMNLSPNRGRRECRVPAAPAASRANDETKHTSIVTTGPPRSPGIPARNGFNGFLRALPGDRALLPPSPANCSASLTPASGRQDHTTSPSASAPFVCNAARVHRIPPRVRDDRASAPLWDGTVGDIEVIWGRGEEVFFLKMRLNRAIDKLPVGQISGLHCLRIAICEPCSSRRPIFFIGT